MDIILQPYPKEKSIWNFRSLQRRLRTFTIIDYHIMRHSNSKIDDIDLRILNILQSNARTTIKEIAEQVGMSSTPVFERVKRLEREGYIQKYVALLDAAKLGYTMVAFIQISLTLHNLDEVNAFTERVTEFSEVMECYHTTGESDFLLKILVTDMEEFNHFILYKLSEIPNLSHVRTQFALSTRKRTTEIGIVPDR